LNFFAGVDIVKETIYIFSSGELMRKDNSLFFVTEQGEKKHIPVENVKEIMVFGEINLNKKLLEFLSQKEIILSVFNYYGFYMGSFYPRTHNNSGFIILKQAEHYLDYGKRLVLARKLVEGAIKNELTVMKYYNRRGRELSEHISRLESRLLELNDCSDIPRLMQKEADAKKYYYDSFNIIINSEDFEFKKRTKRPPKDKLNALISFSNSLIYSITLREIYSTHLDPRIGFLHETNFRRFSLNLDISEIFKPIIGDRAIFQVVNKGILKDSDFDELGEKTYLSDKGKMKFLEVLEQKLNETIKPKKLGKQVSYRTLIRMELYKIEKHIMGEEDYEPFIMEW